MKKQIGFSVLVLVLCTTAQGATRMVFSTDRDGAVVDAFMVNPATSQIDQVTDLESFYVHNPVLAEGGYKIIYDVEYNLHMDDMLDPGDYVVLTGDVNPCKTSDGEYCFDPDVGPRINQANDYLVVFTREFQYDSTHRVAEIWLATMDVSEGELTDFVAIPPDMTPTNDDQLDPAFCGDDHVVWSRPASGDFYYREICIIEVNEDGPVGSENCYWNDDQLDDRYPDCDSDGSQLAWARPDATAYTKHDIWKMPCEDGECDSESPTVLTNHGYDEYWDDIRPVWAPGDSQIGWQSTRPTEGLDEESEYDLWRMNQSDGSGKDNITDDSTYDDTEPSWGTEVLE